MTSMDAFGIEQGVCGPGTARYANGLITLPDGAVRAVEDIVRLEPASGDPSTFARTSRKTSAVAGSVRDALGTVKPLGLPLRLALSTVRAGLGAIEEGLLPSDARVFALTFLDGASFRAVMPPPVAALMRRDAEIARGALERAGRPSAAALSDPVAETATDAALTSIFRYEKRNGRLRRVSAKADE